MTPETFEQALDAILAEMREVMLRKQRDYGPGNIAAFGELGVIVRAHDKLARLRHLLWERRGQAPQNEPIEDSWLDLANYGLIGLMCRRGWWGLPMEEERRANQPELAEAVWHTHLTAEDIERIIQRVRQELERKGCRAV